jgi:phenylacetate-CoA ligase
VTTIPTPLELRTQEQRDAELVLALQSTVIHAKKNAPYYAASLANVEASQIESLEALSTLPVLRKAELLKIQTANPPLGGLLAVPINQIRRIFQSPGPIYEPQGLRTDYFRSARALRAAGFEAGDVVHNGFAYHSTPGAWILEGGLHEIGCTVFPGGVGQTEQQVQAMLQIRPSGYVGTPSFLKILIEKCIEHGSPDAIVRTALVSGEALTPSLRSWFAQHHVRVSQAYATAELGVIAYEGQDPAEGLIVDEGVIVEIVEPGGSKPMPFGETGEVVVTHFGAEYPMIRFATGDLSAFHANALSVPASCGRTNVRIKGWLGRADQTTKVRGMFVHPGQVSQISSRFPDIKKVRLVLTGRIGEDKMTVYCELAGGTSSDGLKLRVADAVRDVTRLRADVQFAVLGALADDGKLIEDARDYS